jgi:hypothetical protein
MSRIIQSSSTNVISTCYTEAKLNSINILTNYNFVLPKFSGTVHHEDVCPELGDCKIFVL